MKGIPVLHVEGDCIARAWEESLIVLSRDGCSIRTQYDKPEDPPSKDATMTIVVQDPLKEPMIHKDFPGGPEDLQEYVMEVLDGIKDHLVRDCKDPEDTRWEYTYHQRL
ncbi:MAG: thymidylate synthase, partial [Acidobacteria bacterium]|nr:thymidylate synthase [Acidobacteriota bacterium]